MSNLFLLSAVIGFGPAFTIMWFSMRKYDWPYVKGACFDDRKVFFLLAIGMVLGTIVYTIERVGYASFRSDVDNVLLFSPIMFFLVYVLGLGLIQTVGKYIILNFPGLEGRPDSQFLGVAIGTGMSSTWIVGFSYVSLVLKPAQAVVDANVTGVSETVSLEPSIMSWIALLMLSINVALIHVSVGATLGHSGIRKEGLRAIPRAFVPHLIFNLIMFPWFAWRLPWISIAIATPISFLIFREIYLHSLPESLPDEIKKEIAENERKARKRVRARRKG